MSEPARVTVLRFEFFGGPRDGDVLEYAEGAAPPWVRHGMQHTLHSYRLIFSKQLGRFVYVHWGEGALR